MRSTISRSRPTASGSSSSARVVTDSRSSGSRTRWNTSGMPGRRGTLRTSISFGPRGDTAPQRRDKRLRVRQYVLGRGQRRPRAIYQDRRVRRVRERPGRLRRGSRQGAGDDLRELQRLIVLEVVVRARKEPEFVVTRLGGEIALP